MLPPRANHLRLVPEVRQDAPKIFRADLRALAAEIAETPEVPGEPIHIQQARLLAYLVDKPNATLTRRVERDFVAALFAELSRIDPPRPRGKSAS